MSRRQQRPHKGGIIGKRLGGHIDASAQGAIYDTSSYAQRQRLLAYLRRDSIDTITARQALNILMPAARIKELRKAGYNISTIRIDKPDPEGRTHSRIALYVLSSKGGK